MTSSTTPEVPSNAARLASGEAAADDLQKLRFIRRVLGNFAHAPQSDRADAYAMVRELTESYWKAARALATSPPAPSETAAQATGEAVAWGYAGTVGNAIAQLQTMDAELPIYAAMHLEDGRCIARGVTFSRERVVNERWIDSRRDDVPYSIVVWSQPVESLHASPTASTSAGLTEAEPSEDTALLDWLDTTRLILYTEWNQVSPTSFAFEGFKVEGFKATRATARAAIRAARSAALASSSTEGGETR